MSHDLNCIYVSETDYYDYTFMLVFYLVLCILVSGAFGLRNQGLRDPWSPESRPLRPLASGVRDPVSLGSAVAPPGTFDEPYLNIKTTGLFLCIYLHFVRHTENT